ncbi:PH domain-containing protein [Nocardioides yefusunii]|uniref:PH domain-containing protein n=1 Tax=Nocardioides yefusunii TaxID=2500546 RepID=A0ABW1QW88_9ACTN|nr:PH domain-containing protein [Nocardioides yefusunii]
MNDETPRTTPEPTSAPTPAATPDVIPDAAPLLPVGLRDPAHRVSPHAVKYWRVVNTIVSVVVLAVLVPVYVIFFAGTWWATALLALIVVWCLVEVFIAPQVRHRVHRWEVDDVAVHTLSGFIDRDSRIAPVNRIQTVDTSRGFVMRRFGLTSVTVTTASSAGSISLDCLDDDVAREVVARLTALTAASEGDAT